MSLIARFVEYATAFEKAYATDEWSVLSEFFTDNVRYDSPLPAPFGGRPEGREAVIAYLEASVSHLDRRFETRALDVIEGPREEGNAVVIKGTATYTAAGVPDFVLTLEETARFEGDRIVDLADDYSAEALESIVEYIREHGAKLGMDPVE